MAQCFRSSALKGVHLVKPRRLNTGEPRRQIRSDTLHECLSQLLCWCHSWSRKRHRRAKNAGRKPATVLETSVFINAGDELLGGDLLVGLRRLLP